MHILVREISTAQHATMSEGHTRATVKMGKEGGGGAGTPQVEGKQAVTFNKAVMVLPRK